VDSEREMERGKDRRWQAAGIWNPWWRTALIQPCAPAPPIHLHLLPLQQLIRFLSDVLTSASLSAPLPTAASHRHKYIILSCSFALLSCLCFCWSASASACAWFSAVNLHATWNKPAWANRKRITSTCAPELEAKMICICVCLCCSILGEGMCKTLPHHMPYSPRRLEGDGSSCLTLPT